jgi:hypothetical protein
MKIGNRKGEGTLLSRCEEDLSSDYVHMKIGYKKGEGTLLYQGVKKIYPAIRYI